VAKFDDDRPSDPRYWAVKRKKKKYSCKTKRLSAS